MNIEELQPGDMIFASADIVNDGSVPDVSENELFAKKGTRGMLVNTGHLEEQPDQTVCLVRFEDSSGELGLPVTVWPDEISAEQV